MGHPAFSPFLRKTQKRMGMTPILFSDLILRYASARFRLSMASSIS
jgi:hypothetical protein